MLFLGTSSSGRQTHFWPGNSRKSLFHPREGDQAQTQAAPWAVEGQIKEAQYAVDTQIRTSAQWVVEAWIWAAHEEVNANLLAKVKRKKHAENDVLWCGDAEINAMLWCSGAETNATIRQMMMPLLTRPRQNHSSMAGRDNEQHNTEVLAIIDPLKHMISKLTCLIHKQSTSCHLILLLFKWSSSIWQQLLLCKHDKSCLFW